MLSMHFLQNKGFASFRICSKMRKNKIKGVKIMDSIIFDVDGTLWNSTETVARAWSVVLSQEPDINVEITPERLSKLFGKILPEIAANLFPDQPKERQLELIERCCQKEEEFLSQQAAPVYDRLEDTLKILSKKYPLYIVSNCQAGYIEVFLKSTGYGHYFQDHLCSGDTGLQKGDNIKEIIRRNQLKSAIYVGDTLGDYTASKEAGIPFVYAAYGFGEVPSCDYSIQSPYYLVKLFADESLM